MFSHPAVIVHGIDQVRQALRPGRPVVLLSGLGAALYAGTGWWRAMMDIGQAEFPGTVLADILDCAAAPGRAMDALRAGQRAIRLDASVPAWSRVLAIADRSISAVVTAGGLIGGSQVTRRQSCARARILL
jgi:hypothetical protein